MEVRGNFDVKRFYEVLAGILSEKYKAKITADIQEVPVLVAQPAGQKMAKTDPQRDLKDNHSGSGPGVCWSSMRHRQPGWGDQYSHMPDHLRHKRDVASALLHSK